MTSTTPGRVIDQIRKWRGDLVNLSRSNRLIYFRHTKSSSLKIEAPESTDLLARLGRETAKGLAFFEPPEKPTARVPNDELLLDVKPRPEPPPLPAPRPTDIVTQCADRAVLHTVLRNLERRTTQEYMDKGLWTLYLGIGMLEWVERSDHDERVASPIYLVPVSVHRDSPHAPFRLRRADEDPAINPALALKLEHDFGVTLPSLEDV
jgi:hypothetical protein